MGTYTHSERYMAELKSLGTNVHVDHRRPQVIYPIRRGATLSNRALPGWWPESVGALPARRSAASRAPIDSQSIG